MNEKRDVGTQGLLEFDNNDRKILRHHTRECPIDLSERKKIKIFQDNEEHRRFVTQLLVNRAKALDWD